LAGTSIAHADLEAFMSRFARVVTAIALATGALSLPARAQLASFYLPQDIGSLGGGYTVGNAINDNGEIAGYATTPDGNYHAFRYSDQLQLEVVDAPPDAYFLQAYGINNAGDVVGGIGFTSGGGSGFVARRGQPIQLVKNSQGQFVSLATAINESGVVTGVGPGDNTFRFFPNGTFQPLGDAGLRTVAWGINASGQLAGYQASFTGGYKVKAVRYSDDTGFVDLGSFGGPTNAGIGINTNGVVVGWSDLPNGQGHAFRAVPGAAIEDLGTLGGPASGAIAINDDGAIVGYASLANMQQHAFVYTDAEGMIDLNDRVAHGTARIDIASGINRSGQIVATYSVLGRIGTYRLTPTTPDVTPPTIDSVTATPGTLWPPDGTMRSVTVTVAVHDDRDPAPHCALVDIGGVENDQRVVADFDVQLTGDLSASLRATRSGASTGRTYVIAVACTDFSNNRATGSTTVVVPHDASRP
jgi:probable HAF family extracellular repeat protein